VSSCLCRMLGLIRCASYLVSTWIQVGALDYWFV
jgi:hypothetical protein